MTDSALRPPRLRAFAAILMLVGMVCAQIGVASAQSTAEACLAVDQKLSADGSLPRTATILTNDTPLKIVAIGSSSTLGLWQSDAAKTYPGRMQSELLRLKPGLRVDVINSGRNADTIPGNVARFERDVFAHAPDLVVWQVGTNDVTWLESNDSLTRKIVDGVRALKASGADVILMDQQYAPVILASQYSKMQAAITDAARQAQVPLFSRFALMQRAVEGGVAMSALTAWDGLHNSAEGYDCVGRALARAILAAVAEPPRQAIKRERRR